MQTFPRLRLDHWIAVENRSIAISRQISLQAPTMHPKLRASRPTLYLNLKKVLDHYDYKGRGSSPVLPPTTAREEMG
jgi:hypothetical protein